MLSVLLSRIIVIIYITKPITSSKQMLNLVFESVPNVSKIIVALN